MKRKAVIFCILVCLAMTSCSYNPFITNNRITGSPGAAVAGAAVGAGSIALLNGPKWLMAITGLGGGMLGYYLTTMRHDAAAIIQAGGQVYTVGDFVGIYIPSDRLFEPNTTDFLPGANAILESAAAILERYPNNNIIISGNTSGFYRARWELRISEERAQKVSSYMWDYGFGDFFEGSNTMRHLNYVGYGDFFPIASSYTNKGIRANSRIQIVSYPTTCHLVGGDQGDTQARCCPTDKPC